MGHSLIILSLSCARSSARIERLVAVQKVVGSNPAGRTIYIMSLSKPDALAVNTATDNLEVVLERRKEHGELAMPNFLASLELLPLEQRHLIGTTLRQGVCRRLVHQNASEQFSRKLAQRQFREQQSSLLHQLCQKLRVLIGLPPIELSPGEPSQLPSYKSEVEWLRDNIDEACPTQCLLFSEICSQADRHDLAKAWYAKGLQATRVLAEKYPDTPISIIQ